MPKDTLLQIKVMFATWGGAMIGMLIWSKLASLMLMALGSSYGGFPSILGNFLSIVGGALLGATGFAFTMSRGRFRQDAGWILSFLSLAALLWSAKPALDFMRVEGRRVALVVYGVPMAWSCMLGLWGCRMLRTVPSGTQQSMP